VLHVYVSKPTFLKQNAIISDWVRFITVYSLWICDDLVKMPGPGKDLDCPAYSRLVCTIFIGVQNLSTGGEKHTPSPSWGGERGGGGGGT